MKKVREKKSKGKVHGLISYIREDKATFAVYIVLRIVVIGVLIRSIFAGQYESAFICGLSLVLFLVPAFIEKNFGIRLPTVLEIVVLLFIFAAEILGEIGSFYQTVPHWDTMLHTVNGFLFAAVGFALCDIINRNSSIKFSLSPAFLAIVAFCLSMTVGVMWEFFEFSCDAVLKTDTQKDTVVYSIHSTLLDTEKTNTPVRIEGITETVVITEDGKEYRLSDYGVEGYLDVGLHDTIKDMFVNFIGATVFSIIGFIYVKQRGKGRVAGSFIPVLRENEGTASGDEGSAEQTT